MSSSLLKACLNKVKPDPADQRTFVQSMRDFLINDVKAVDRGTCFKVAQLVVEKYPDTFEAKIDGQLFGQGWEALGNKIYSAIGYKKGSTKEKRPLSGTENENENSTVPKTKKKKVDAYGCVDYAPPLGDGESNDTQEEKRKLLLDFFETLSNCSKNEKDEAIRLMDLTYATQRALINAPDRDLFVTTTDWPLLKIPEFFYKHCDRLLGRDIVQCWNNCLQKNGKTILDFFNQTHYKKTDLQKKRAIYLEYNDASSNDRNQIAKTVVMFPLLLFHFGENPDQIYKIVDVSSRINFSYLISFISYAMFHINLFLCIVPA